jgi:putative proteasome-type protease
MVEHRYEKLDLEKISVLWEQELKNALKQMPEEWMEAVLRKLPNEVPED